MITQGHKLHDSIVHRKLCEPRERVKLTEFYLIREDSLEDKIFVNKEQE